MRSWRRLPPPRSGRSGFGGWRATFLGGRGRNEEDAGGAARGAGGVAVAGGGGAQPRPGGRGGASPGVGVAGPAAPERRAEDVGHLPDVRGAAGALRAGAAAVCAVLHAGAWGSSGEGAAGEAVADR